jgi:hypothetical protein
MQSATLMYAWLSPMQVAAVKPQKDSQLSAMTSTHTPSPVGPAWPQWSVLDWPVMVLATDRWYWRQFWELPAVAVSLPDHSMSTFDAHATLAHARNIAGTARAHRVQIP